MLLDVAQFCSVDRGEVREVEAQAAGLNERACLLDVRAENVAQRGVHQVRCRVIALDVLAARAVGVSRDAISYNKFFFGYDTMRDQSGNGVIRAAHVGEMHGAFVVPEFSNVGNLSARFRIKSRVIENNFAFSSGRQFICRAFLRDDSFDAAILRARGEIKIRFSAKSLGKVSIDRIGDVFVPTFP